MRESNLSPHIVKEIFLHHVIEGNPYTAWFAGTKDGPSTAQVKDLVIQMSILLQESRIIRRKRSVGAAKAENYMSDEEHLTWLRAVANALPVDSEKDLKGHSLGSVGSATRETRHAIHQLERTYGSENEYVRSGACFAIGLWAGCGDQKNFLSQIVAGITRHNIVRRRPAGIPELPLAFHGALFYPEQVYERTTSQWIEDLWKHGGAHGEADWFRGAKHALDALHVFWFGLDKRKSLLA